MFKFHDSSGAARAGIVVLESVSWGGCRVIYLQYNPDSLNRTLQAQAVGAEGGGRTESMRFKGVAVETFKFDAEIDAADQLEFSDQHSGVVVVGLAAQLALLETLAYPTGSQLRQRNSDSQSGMLEIAPMEAPLTLFVWGKNRIVPVRLTDFSIAEEAFDKALNPIRAKVSLGLRVLSVDDLGFDHRGGALFMSYLQNKERLAAMVSGSSMADFGVGGL